MNLKYIRTQPKEILEYIEFNRNQHTRYNKQKHLNYYKEVSKEFLEELIKSPEKFLDFLDKNAKNQMNQMLKRETKEVYYEFLPDYSDFFGNHIYWEGLRKWEGEDEYHIVLGS